MSEFVVAKYGGTSMAEPERVKNVVESRPDQRFIVVSAPGIHGDVGEKMTDTLLSYGQSFVNGAHPELTTQKRDNIIDRFDYLYRDLGSRDRATLKDIAAKSLDPPYSQLHSDGIDYFAAQGELLSSRYFARLVGGSAVTTAVRFDNQGHVDKIATNQAVLVQSKEAKRDSMLRIVPGYFGYDPDNKIRLLGRGGSDRTGAIYAAALGIDYENWSDVDGIFATNPKIIPEALVLSEVTRDEVREGAHGGAKVLQGDTIADLNGSSVEVTVKNTKAPEKPGTRVVTQLNEERYYPVVALSCRDDLQQVTVRQMGISRQVGFGSMLFDAIKDHGLSYEHAPGSQDSQSVTIHEGKDQEHLDKINELADYLRSKVSHTGNVTLDSRGAVYVVGEGLRDASHRQAALIRTLGEAAVCKIMITPVVNDNSPSIALLTHERGAAETLLRAIYDKEILPRVRDWM